MRKRNILKTTKAKMLKPRLQFTCGLSKVDSKFGVCDIPCFSLMKGKMTKSIGAYTTKIIVELRICLSFSVWFKFKLKNGKNTSKNEVKISIFEI